MHIKNVMEYHLFLFQYFCYIFKLPLDNHAKACISKDL